MTKNYRILISVLYTISIFIQENFELIQSLGFTETQVNSVKLLGALIYISLNNLDLIPGKIKK